MPAIDPTKKYQTSNGGDTLPVLCAYSTATVGANRQLVAAQTGKRIRLMGWILQANGAGLSGVTFKDGNGGSTLCLLNITPNTNGANDKLPIVDSGYFETTAGNGLYADIATTDLLATIFYIAYVP